MKRLHYAWIVVIVTFLALLTAQAVRAAPGVIITSLESEFGWSRTAISFAISLSILTFGLGGPLGGTLIDRFGPRLTTTSCSSRQGSWGSSPSLWHYGSARRRSRECRRWRSRPRVRNLQGRLSWPSRHERA